MRCISSKTLSELREIEREYILAQQAANRAGIGPATPAEAIMILGKENEELRSGKRRLEAFQRGVFEALNSGDGTYRP